MKIVAVAETPTLTPSRSQKLHIAGGGRVELSVEFPDQYATILDRDDVRKRIRLLLDEHAERIATILQVAEKDRQHELAHPPRQKADDAGPDQIAGVGPDAETIEVDADGQELRRFRGGKLVKKGVK